MAYITADDAPAPRYMVVAVHSDHEQTIRLFIFEQAARDAYAEAIKNGEAYLSKIL